MEKSFRKDVLEKCWSCGEGIDKDDNCFCDRQSLKIRDLSERIKVSDEHFKESVEMYMETINGLESRIRELEADEEFHICKNNEYVEQIKNLEAERDRLKAEIERQKRLDLSGECDRLRSRHAALVEAAREVLPVTEDSWQRRKLKAALGEVK